MSCEMQLVRLPQSSRRLILASIIDITESRRAESAMSESETQLRLALEAGRSRHAEKSRDMV